MPALFAAEGNCAGCRYYEYYRVRDGGRESTAVVGMMPAPLSPGELEAEKDAALAAWAKALGL